MIYEKRGRWCYRDSAGNLHKFVTEAAAKESAGICECEDCKCDPCTCNKKPVKEILALLNTKFPKTLKSLDDELEVEED